jgi:hypothetical protein
LDWFDYFKFLKRKKIRKLLREKERRNLIRRKNLKKNNSSNNNNKEKVQLQELKRRLKKKQVNQWIKNKNKRIIRLEMEVISKLKRKRRIKK